MRPIVKGPSPQDQYLHYRDALDDLTERVGYFCSYCEQPIKHATEVEHVQPKSLEPELERSWENLLLSCKSCNSTKGNEPVNLDQVAIPDRDNTFRGLVFLEGGRIGISPDLTDAQTELMAHRQTREAGPTSGCREQGRSTNPSGQAHGLAQRCLGQSALLSEIDRGAARYGSSNSQ